MAQSHHQIQLCIFSCNPIIIVIIIMINNPSLFIDIFVIIIIIFFQAMPADKFDAILDQLPLQNMLQLSMDGPAINWKFHQVVDEKTKDEHGASLISIHWILWLAYCP